MCSLLLNYKKGKYIQCYIGVGLLLSVNSFVCNATEQYYFNIPEMNAAPALDKLADTSGYSLIYPFDNTTIIVTNSVIGTYSLSDALEKLLLNTTLSATVTQKRVIAVSFTLSTDNNDAPPNDTDIVNIATDTIPKITSITSTQNIAKIPTKEFQIEGIQIIGSRRLNRSPSDALAPLDIISKRNLATRGNSDIISTLANVIPSYNVRQEAISDAGTLVRPANLRGLPTDSILILVNGKRRHRSGVIYEFISGLNVGAHAVDLEPIPTIALKSVEVLRDGAAAQYGSDAIAGVINFRLENNPDISRIELRSGQYYQGDGARFEVSGIYGTTLSDGGSANFSFEFSESNATSRGIQDPAVQSLIDSGISKNDIQDPVVIWGAPEITNNIKIFSNIEMNIGKNKQHKQLYLFGNWAQRDVEGSFFYRNPNTRASIFTNPNSGARLFFDMTSNNTGNCPAPTIPNGIGDAEALEAVFSNTNCFAFNERFPGGFTPRFGGTVTDSSVAGGIRGSIDKIGPKLNYDISLVMGRNLIDYKLRNSVNASFGENSPRNFELGSQVQTERVFNADFTYPLDLGFETDLNIAFGYQYHFEEFEVLAGELASYAKGPFSNNGEAIGANGFPGFSPDTANKNKRNSNAFYVDIETDITDAFSVSLAMRGEKIGSLANTFDGKLSARLQVIDEIAIRSTLSTGFRAPTVGQTSLQRISTSNSIINDVVVQERSQLVSALSPIASARSGGELEPEKATSFGFGVLLETEVVNVTLDYFYIDVDDRLSLFSSEVMPSDALLLAASKVNSDVTNIQYYANDFDSRTQGFDLVASLPFEFSGGESLLSLAFNYTNSELNVTNPKSPISNINTLKERENGVPKTRAVLTYSHTEEDISAMVRINYYGRFYNAQFNDVSLIELVDPIVITDMEVSYKVTDNLALSVGAKNVFDVFPDEFSKGRTAGFLGAIYPLNSPAGFNGGHYYLRMGWDF